MSEKKLYRWDPKAKANAEEINVDPSQVRQVVRRYWNMPKGPKVEGCTIVMKDGSEIGVCEDFMAVNRALGLIDPLPAGITDPPRVWAPAKGTEV